VPFLDVAHLYAAENVVGLARRSVDMEPDLTCSPRIPLLVRLRFLMSCRYRNTICKSRV
jgi:hypothetical protein